MKDWIWLDREVVIAIHEAQLGEHGGEIVRAVRQFEGSPDPVQTASGSRVALEIVRPVWRELQQEMLTKLDDVTLEDLCQKAQAAGIQTDALQRLDFSI